MPKLLTLLPDYEAATSGWSRVARIFLNDVVEGYTHVVLSSDQCIPSKIHDLLKNDPDIIGISGLSVGHGNVCVTTVQYGQTEFACGWSVNALLKNKYFNKCSCLVGKGLLPDLVRYGLGVGCGEITEYWIYITWHPDPKQDIAFYFVDANYEFDRQLMRGKTAKEAYDAMIKKYYDNAKKLEHIPDAAKLLRYDADNRKLFGNENWKAPAPGQPPSPPPSPPEIPPSPPQYLEYQGTQSGTVLVELSGIVETKLLGIIPLTLKFDGVKLNGSYGGTHNGKMKISSGYQVTIDYDFVSATDKVERYVGRTIDEPIKSDFWQSQPKAVLKRAQNGIFYREIVTLSPGQHYVECATSGYYPDWTVTVYVNGQKIGSEFTGRDKPARFNFVIAESGQIQIGGEYSGNDQSAGSLQASGTLQLNVWLSKKKAITNKIDLTSKIKGVLTTSGSHTGKTKEKQ